MYIAGTAGHVDHGKTALVKALTGTDTDRLPEEKRRGLTIELGFALIEGPFPVGIIDVPGHERFIRNMVAGTWALHCALLVVAADDGWMRQTEDHAHVLKGMGTPAVVLVVTKADLADGDRIRFVREDALRRCMDLFGYRPESAVVSAHHHTGIEQCRDALFASLKRPDPRRFPPCLYVDRHFTIQGAGAVAAGSLVGGPLSAGDQAVLLTEGVTVRIRSIQTHGRAADTVAPAARTAVTLQGVRPEQLSRGSCITLSPGDFFTKTSLTAVLHGIMDGEFPKLRNHQEAEMLYGTRHGRCTVHFIGPKGNRGAVTASLSCREEPVMFWGQRFILLRPGGSEILAWGQVLQPGRCSAEDRGPLLQLINAYGGIPEEIKSYALLRLAVRGCAYMKESPKEKLSLLGAVHIPVGSWYIGETLLKKLARRVLALTGRPGGASREELCSSLEIQESCVRDLLSFLAAAKKIARQNHIYRSVSEKKILSPAAEAFLKRVESGGIRGLEVKHAGKDDRDALGVLVREGYVIILESTLIFSMKIYKQTASRILEGRRSGDLFTIADAKARVPLSRKYMIPLLNKMEKDGLVMRIGDKRKVV